MSSIIESRICAIGAQLDLIDLNLAAEMQKSFFTRRYKLLSFLYKERCVYRFALAELENLLKLVEEKNNVLRQHEEENF